VPERHQLAQHPIKEPVDIYKEAGGLDLYSLSIVSLHTSEWNPPRAAERSDGAARTLIPIRSAKLTDPTEWSRACPEQLSEKRRSRMGIYACVPEPTNHRALATEVKALDFSRTVT